MANDSHTHSTYAPKASPTFTGTITNAGTISTAGAAHTFNTQYGNIQLGPMNSSWAHIYTNIASGFYFNKQLAVNGSTVWNAGNDGSGSGLDADLLDGLQGSQYALSGHNHSGVYLPISGKAADSNLLDGLDLHTGRNNEANKVVRTQANGYADFGWINTTSGVASGTPARIYCSQDSYLRYYTPSQLAPYILNQGSTKNAHTHDYAASSHTHSYLPLAGGTMTGDVKFGSGKAPYVEHNSSTGRVSAPGGAQYTGGSSVTGAFKIKLPTATANNSTMLSFEVVIYDYASRESVSMRISGYAYTSGVNWHNHTVTILSPLQNKDFTVRFGSDGTSNCLWIGELASTWAYPKVGVFNFMGGHSAVISEFASGWTITAVTAFDTVQDTMSGNLPYARVLDDGITSQQLANSCVNSEHIVSGSIDAIHIATDTITATKIAPNAIGNSELAGAAVAVANMQANSVDSTQYVDGSIDRVHLAADIIDGTKIADDAINSEHYANGSIDAVHIASNSITATQLAADCVGASELANNSVASANIVDNSITAGDIAPNAIGASELNSNVVNSEHYVDNSIDAAHLNVSGNGTTSQWLRSDGDGSMSWVAPPSNYAATSHTHSYLPLTGGTLTGALTATSFTGSGAGLTNLPAASGTLGPVQYSGWVQWRRSTKNTGDFSSTGDQPTTTHWGTYFKMATELYQYYTGSAYTTADVSNHGSTSSQVMFGWQIYVNYANSGSDYRIWTYYRRFIYRTVA